MAWVGDNIFSYGQAYVTGFCVSCPERKDGRAAIQADLDKVYHYFPRLRERRHSRQAIHPAENSK